jgi:branched-chain amino acid transport system ATP-binding protein
MLEVHDVVAAYGPVRALDGVDVSVAAGTITAVLGANGAGKTTLLRTVNGLLRVRSGRVRLEGRDVTRVRPEEMARLGMAHAPEGRGVVVELTVEDNLRLGALWRRDRAGSSQDMERAYEIFPPLRARRRQAAANLSGGERQMLAIGRALMARPKLLLLDEPSLGLAPRTSAEIIGIIRRLRDETGLTVLLVEQNATTALSVADRVVVLNLGRKVADDRADTFAVDERLRAAYLGF